MKLFKASPCFFMLFLSALFLGGCAGFKSDLRTIDNLPENAPKGYFEFYTVENEDAVKLHKEFRGTFFIYKIENGVEKEIKEMVWSWQTRRRVAVPPGRHTFRIKFASADMKISVTAIEKMIVPVRFTYTLGETKYYYQVGRGSVHKQYFNMVPDIGKPVPYTGE